MFPVNNDGCQFRRSVIVLDKPVYRNGEQVHATLYNYDLWSKKPLAGCASSVYAVLSLYDGQDKLIAQLTNTVEQKNSPAEEDKVAQYFRYEIPKDLAGGSYKIKANNSAVEEARLIIMKFNAKSYALIGDWNAQGAKVGDMLLGKITLKIFTKNAALVAASDVQLQYSFVSEGKTLKSGKETMVDNQLDVMFIVPAEFQKLLVFSASAQVSGATVEYKKEFSEPNYDDIVVDFAHGSGKPVKAMINRFYFCAFETAARKIENVVTNAKIVRVAGNRREVEIDNVFSEEEGKGSFELPLEEEDFDDRAKFVMEIDYDNGTKKSYEVLNTAGLDLSPLYMEADRRVFKADDAINIMVSSLQFRGKALLVVQDKTKIYHKKILNISGESTKVSISALELGFSQGGVLTVQLYTAKQPDVPVKIKQQQIAYDEDVFSYLPQRYNLFQRRIKPQPVVQPQPEQNPDEYNGIVQQEFEIFVEPAKYVSPSIEIKSNFIPNGKVEYSVGIDSDCDMCSAATKAWAMIDVVDESAFVEVDQGRRNPSLFARVFLEKEVNTAERFLFNAYQYLDHLFFAATRNDDNRLAAERKIELLLGNQSARRFFFDPARLREFMQNQYQEKYKKVREYLSQLMPSTGNVYTPVRRVFAQPMLYKGGAMNFAAPEMMMDVQRAPMMMNKAAAAMPMADGMEMAIAPAAPAPAMVQKEEKAPQQSDKDQKETFEQIIKMDNILHRKFQLINSSKLTGVFALPDLAAKFTFRVHLISENGYYGFAMKTISIRKEFNLVADIPINFYKGETFILPIVLENNRDSSRSVVIKADKSKRVNIEANGSAVHEVSLTQDNTPFKLRVEDDSGKELAVLNISPAVVSPGIAQASGKTGYVSTKDNGASRLSHTADLPPSLLPGASLRVCFRNSALGLILDALKALNRQPTGCFEQASTTTFPLILALKILLSLDNLSPEFEQLKREMIANLRKGIALLLKYECAGEGGFEWFGKAPCHSTLSAYGLWQFLEAAALPLDAPLFDSALIDRTVGFLGKSRNRFGGFALRNGLDALGNPDQAVSDLYITFVVSLNHRKYRDQFADELSYAAKLYRTFVSTGKGLDSYKLAVIGLMLLNTEDRDGAYQVIAELLRRQNKQTGAIEQAESSITRSSGLSLAVETTALSLMVLLRAKAFEFTKEIELCMKFLTGNMTFGGYSSTQATILTLLAFADYLKTFKGSADSAAFAVEIQDKQAGTLSVKAQGLDSQCRDYTTELASHAKPGKSVNVAVVTKQSSPSGGNFLFSIDLLYFAELPVSVADSPLQLRLTRRRTDDVFVYTIRVRNLRGQDQGMVTYEFNKPSALDFNVNDLDDMKRREQVDHYEIRNDNSQIVFYFRGLKKNASVEFAVSLSHRFEKNAVVERAHALYLYYNKEGSAVYAIPE